MQQSTQPPPPTLGLVRNTALNSQTSDHNPEFVLKKYFSQNLPQNLPENQAKNLPENREKTIFSKSHNSNFSQTPRFSSACSASRSLDYNESCTQHLNHTHGIAWGRSSCFIEPTEKSKKVSQKLKNSGKSNEKKQNNSQKEPNEWEVEEEAKNTEAENIEAKNTEARNATATGKQTPDSKDDTLLINSNYNALDNVQKLKTSAKSRKSEKKSEFDVPNEYSKKSIPTEPDDLNSFRRRV